MSESVKPPVFERALLALAPGWAAARARGRREFLQHELAVGHLRKYEAASGGRRNDGWRRPGTSANAEISASAAMLRNGARQLVRDNGHAASALNVIESNVIGTGIRPTFDAGSDRASRSLQALWERFNEQPTSGAGGVGNFYDRQGLALRAVVESGSVLLRRRVRGSSVLLGFRVEMMEPDYLYPLNDGSAGSNLVVGGKEYNKEGDIVAYHLYPVHPGDPIVGAMANFAPVRVLAEDMSYAFRTDRPGQADGASWFAPVMMTLRDHADTRDAYQLRQKIAACYTAFIHETEPGQGSTTKTAPIAPVMEPGRIEALPPGKQVSFASPPGVEGMSEFDRDQLLTIAAGLGIPYEALTGNLANVNFLSGRIGWLAFYRNIDKCRSRVVIPQICEPEMRWFLQAATIELSLRKPVRVTWTAPHRDLLDPVKEINALREEMRLGALSYPDMVMMRGRNPERVLDDIKKWTDEIKKRELVFDWDVTRVSRAGNPTTTAKPGNEPGADDTDNPEEI